MLKGGNNVLFSFENIPVKFLGAFDFTREKGHIHTHHGNSYYALSIRLNGSTTFNIKGKELTAKSGELIVIPPNLAYSQYTLGERILAIHFDSLKDFKIDTIEKHTVKDWDATCKLFNEIYENYSKKPQGWYYKACSVLYELLYLLHNESELKASKELDNIDIAMNFLEKHYTDSRLSILKLAKVSGYSEAYFRRLFLKRFGVTPIERLNYLRIERAKKLLESKTRTMQEIAEDIGILDPKYFSTWFKKHVGFSPREYTTRLGG